jgi:long-chain acyl-CoA synthetase
MADRDPALAGADACAWPAMGLKQIESLLCAPGQRFEMETVVVGGVPTRTWKNAPPSLPALLQFGRSYGDRLFCVYEEDRVTFDAFFCAAATLAHEFQRRGIVKGDRIALAMRNLPEWPVVFFGAAACGAIVVPLNAWWTGGELEYALADSGARLLVCDGERYERIAPHLATLTGLTDIIVTRGAAGQGDPLSAIIGEPNSWAALTDLSLPDVVIAPDDDSTIFYTSGTTGNPKGALGSHRNMMTNIFSTAYVGARP